MLDTHMKKKVTPILTSVGKFFLKLGMTANQMTILGFLVGICSGFLIFFNHPILAVVVLWTSGLFDAVDGTMARLTKPTPFGCILDVGFDRLVEASVILGLAFKHPEHMGVLLILTVSILYGITVFLTIGAVSKNESNKSFKYSVALAERTEGFIILSAMTLFQEYLFSITIAFIAIEIFSTIQRLLEAKKNLE